MTFLFISALSVFYPLWDAAEPVSRNLSFLSEFPDLRTAGFDHWLFPSFTEDAAYP